MGAAAGVLTMTGCSSWLSTKTVTFRTVCAPTKPETKALMVSTYVFTPSKFMTSWPPVRSFTCPLQMSTQKRPWLTTRLRLKPGTWKAPAA